MIVARTAADLRMALARARREGSVVGFVPTMGALHEGHLSLLRAARIHADLVVLSIFVNPLQFGPNEDLARYPRDEPHDLRLAEDEKVDVAFLPSLEEMYPDGSQVRISAGELGTILEGAHRPGHFDGVCTVVAKLFNLVEPDVSFFGQKDAQQVAVIQAMARDLSYRTQIVVGPTVRASDGVALSSRNAYLSESGRHKATLLYRALQAGARIAQGAASAEEVEAGMAEVLDDPEVQVDYARVVVPNDFGPWEKGPALVVAAVRIEGTRLIDNVSVEAPHGASGHTR